jgi:hypothetical protein
MLTLLFLYHDPEEDSRSLASARGSSDRLLVGSCSEAAQLLLSVGLVDAILIHQNHLQHDCDLVTKLKRAAPRTPVMALRDRVEPNQVKPQGITAVCAVDLADEELAKALWLFFRPVLGKQPERRHHTVAWGVERRVNHNWLWLNAE